MPINNLAVAACFVAVALLAVIGTLYVARSRRRLLARFARELGFSFKGAERLEVPKLMREGRLSLRGRLLVRNVMRGTAGGRQVLTFEVHPEARSLSRSSLSYRGRWRENLSSICTFTLPVEVPRLAVCPMSLLNVDLFGFFRSDDRYHMRFESDEFNRAFRVQSDDRKFAFDVLGAEVMSWLLDHPGWAVDFAADWFILRNGALWSPEEYRQAFDFGAGLLDRIPEFVWREHAAGGALETTRDTET